MDPNGVEPSWRIIIPSSISAKDHSRSGNMKLKAIGEVPSSNVRRT